LKAKEKVSCNRKDLKMEKEFFRQFEAKASRANISGKTRNAEAGAAALGGGF